MLRRFATAKPLQTLKLGFISTTLIAGFLGFFRVIDLTEYTTDLLLADSQFLTLLLLPFLGILLAVIVFLETLVTGYRAVTADKPLSAQLTATPAYTLVRTAEAVIASLATGGVIFAITTATQDMPAPAGVGLLLGALVFGLLIFGASLVRGLTELYYHYNATKDS